jgi:hypothetical protein
MSREAIPFVVADISALAKSLRAQLAARDTAPSHVEMLNILARATGRRNFQQLRAGAAGATDAGPAAYASDREVDGAQVSRVAGHFDAEARMVRWPGKTSHQELCLWVLWAQLPSRRTLTEAEVNALVQAKHLFGDHVILRRCLCNSRLLARTPDCREYRRVEREPPPQAAALIRRVLANRNPRAMFSVEDGE